MNNLKPTVSLALAYDFTLRIVDSLGRSFQLPPQALPFSSIISETLPTTSDNPIPFGKVGCSKRHFSSNRRSLVYLQH